MSARDSHRWAWSGTTLRYETGGIVAWSIDVRAIRVLGEATDESGPFGDDWKLCVVTQPGSWIELSMYADDVNGALDWLESQLGAPVDLRLGNSTSLASRVLWPPELAGRPLFEFTWPPPATAFGRLMRRIGYRPAAMSQALTSEVEEWLRR